MVRDFSSALVVFEFRKFSIPCFAQSIDSDVSTNIDSLVPRLTPKSLRIKKMELCLRGDFWPLPLDLRIIHDLENLLCKNTESLKCRFKTAER